MNASTLTRPKAGWLSKALTAMRHSARPPFFMSLLKRTRFDYRKETGDCLDASVVTAPVLWIGRALPEANLAVTRHARNGEVEEVHDHPMLALIQNPNPFYGDIALWMATLVSFLISGNAYWIIVRNGAGRPAELWYTPHWMIEPKWPQDGGTFISHYRYSPGGGAEPMRIEPRDVVHFRHGIDPRNIRMGLSPLDGVIREIFIDLESSNFVASLLRNMGVPGVVISPKGGAMPAPEDVEATKTWFKQAFGGDNRGGPLVMGAPTDVQPYGFNPQQLNMSEGRDVAEERVCACLGIPAAVVGFGAGLQQTKVGATMEELRKLAWNNGVLPFARMLADELQRSLLGEFGPSTGAGTVKIGWDTSEVLALQEDEDKKVDRWGKMLASGAITVYEYRIGIGEAADDSHKFYLRQISVLEVPADGKPPPQRALPDPKTKAERRASEAAYARGHAFALTVQRSGDRLQRAFEAPLEMLFGQLGAAAGEAALPMLESDPALPKGLEGGRGEKADEQLIDAILEKLGIDAWNGRLRGSYEGHYLEVAKSIAEAGERAGLGASLPDVVARSIVAAGGRRAGLIDLENQSRAALFSALAEGRAAGEGAAQLAARIVSEVEGGPWRSAEMRARVIARTETKYAQNISTIERGRAAGVGSFIVYDGRLGPGRSLLTHMARNGSIATTEEALAMAEAEHPNGTLSFAPNFEED
ncbi:phage portal protein, HK97 family [Sphingobium faniae]|nr:phage portal protein, HK97 family [Sphingobium faniae]